MIALLAGVTVGVVVSIFMAVLRFFEVLISFPLEIYRALMHSYRTKLMMDAFHVKNSIEQSHDEPSDSEKMWARHIERMKEKKSKED